MSTQSGLSIRSLGPLSDPSDLSIGSYCPVSTLSDLSIRARGRANCLLKARNGVHTV